VADSIHMARGRADRFGAFVRLVAVSGLAGVLLVAAACSSGSSSPPPPTPAPTPQQYTVTVSAGAGGAVSPASQTVTSGANITITLTPDTGYSIGSASGCGGSLSGSSYVTGSVTGNCTVSVVFEINTYTVAAVAGPGGDVDPASQQVDHGTQATVTLVPDAGYEIDQVSGCSGTVDGNTYTTGAVTGDCTVDASFSLLVLSPPDNVQATAGSAQVTLTWDEVDGALSYNVYYGTSAGIDITTSASFDQLLLLQQSPVMVSELEDGVDYYFVVTAVAGPAESLASAEVSATPSVGAVATFFGSSLSDLARALIVHPVNGDVYLIGVLQDVIPVTAGAWITNPRSTACGGDNIFFTCAGFLARFTPDLSELVAATYLPFNLGTSAGLIADPVTGDVFVAGAGSTNAIGTPGAFQPDYSGIISGRIVRLSEDLTTRIAMTHYGVSGGDFRFTGLALVPADDHEAEGALYAVGTALTSGAPGVSGGAQPAYAGNGDLLLARFSLDLASLHQATYLGGSGNDWTASNYFTFGGIVVHPETGDVYVVNSTASVDFPTTIGALQAAPGPNTVNGYVSRLNADLTELLGSTYFSSATPGTSWNVTGVAVNAGGEIVIAGRAGSNTLAGSEGGAIATAEGYPHGYVARLTPELDAVLQSTFVAVGSGSGVLHALNGLAIESGSGDVLVMGLATTSSDLPSLSGAQLEEVPNAAQFTGAGFVTRLNGDLTEIRQSSWLGPMHDGPYGFALSADGEWVYTSGSVSGTSTWPFTDSGAFPTNPGFSSAVVSGMRSTLAK
jgi:hypothetical protein